MYVAYCCRRSQKGRKSSGEVTSNVSGLVSGWSQIGAVGFQKGTCLLGWGIGKWESLEKHIGKLYWNCESLWEAEMEKHCVLLCYLYSTLSFLAFTVDIIVSSVNEQTAFSTGQGSARNVCLNSPKNSPLQPVLCLLLPPPAQRLQAASLIAMCIYKMKHPAPRLCEENK